MRKTILLFLFLLTGLFVPLANGYVLGYDVAIAGSDGSWADYVFFNNYTLSVPEGYHAHLTSFHVYTHNTSTAQTVAGGIYDSNLQLITSTNSMPVNGLGWYSDDVDIKLLSGTYWVACAYTQYAYQHYVSYSGINGSYTAGYAFDDPVASLTDWGENRISFYYEYTFEPLGGDPAIWAGVYTFGLIALFGVILVMFKMKLPILQFAIGTLGLTLPIGLWTQTSILFSPFLQIIIMLTSLILIVYSVWSYRSV